VTQIKFGDLYVVSFTASGDAKLYFINEIYRTNLHEISSHYKCIRKAKKKIIFFGRVLQ